MCCVRQRQLMCRAHQVHQVRLQRTALSQAAFTHYTRCEGGSRRNTARPHGPTDACLPGRFYRAARGRHARAAASQRVLRYATQSPDLISGRPFTALGTTG
jgi:hypothetical protein